MKPVLFTCLNSVVYVSQKVWSIHIWRGIFSTLDKIFSTLYLILLSQARRHCGLQSPGDWLHGHGNRLSPDTSSVVSVGQSRARAAARLLRGPDTVRSHTAPQLPHCHLGIWYRNIPTFLFNIIKYLMWLLSFVYVLPSRMTKKVLDNCKWADWKIALRNELNP